MASLMQKPIQEKPKNDIDEIEILSPPGFIALCKQHTKNILKFLNTYATLLTQV